MLSKYRYPIFLVVFLTLTIFGLTLQTSEGVAAKYATLLAFILAQAVARPQFNLLSSVGRVISTVCLLIGMGLFLPIILYRQGTVFESVTLAIIGFRALGEVHYRYWRRPPP